VQTFSYIPEVEARYGAEVFWWHAFDEGDSGVLATCQTKPDATRRGILEVQNDPT